MKKVIPFPLQKHPDTAMLAAIKRIERRFGVSFWEYMGFTGDKAEVRKKIDRQLHKETLQIATKMAEEAREP